MNIAVEADYFIEVKEERDRLTEQLLELQETWATYKLEKHGLFNSMKITDAYTYIDSIIGTLPKEDRHVAYTAAYIMYNSVIDYYESNMICTTKEKK
jgi:hypothetical protein